MPISRTWYDTLVDSNGTPGHGTVWDKAAVGTLIDAVDVGIASGTVQTTTSTGNQNDFPISVGCSVLLCNNASLLTLSGFSSGVAGQRLQIISIGAGQVNLAYDSGSSVANRLLNIVTTGLTPLAPGQGRAVYVYDATAAAGVGRWRLLSNEQGAYLTPTFAAGSYTASGGGTWTVAAGDVTTNAYYLRGGEITMSFLIATSTVASTPNNLRLALPNGYTSASTFALPVLLYNEATWVSGGSIEVSAGAAYLALGKINFGAANWANTTDLTYVQGSITIGVN